MRPFRSLLITATALAFSLQGCATAPEARSAASTSGPALWKATDEDTTVYLFGTVHALPKNVDWYRGQIESALTGSDVLVTEIPVSAMSDPASQQIIMSRALLPAGQSLRDLLTDQQRATYEAALASLSMPPAALDRFEPWFAAVTLSVLPLMQNGWTPEMGVEHIIDQRAGPTMQRDAFETLDEQMSLFDGLSQTAQVDYLMANIGQLDKVVPTMDKMVVEWATGDAVDLATLMNDSMADPELANILLYQRNGKWAQWIDDRMDQPGTVFVAVGAGHLAGTKSVQDYLAERGITVTRVQ